MTPRAVFFDVDFTLIYPGPRFQAEGYRAFCAKHGMAADESKFEAGVASAATILDRQEDASYDREVYIAYTAHIIEQMGASGAAVEACAREIYREWAACQHFELYDDVPQALRGLADAGIRVGLISNSHRCLVSFQSHFELQGLISATVSSSEHGFMKPHPSIFSAALQLVDVTAAEAVMVGDNLKQDVEGALRSGMRAILLQRDGIAAATREDVPVIRSLVDLPSAIERLG